VPEDAPGAAAQRCANRSSLCTNKLQKSNYRERHAIHRQTGSWPTGSERPGGRWRPPSRCSGPSLVSFVAPFAWQGEAPASCGTGVSPVEGGRDARPWSLALLSHLGVGASLITCEPRVQRAHTRGKLTASNSIRQHTSNSCAKANTDRAPPQLLDGPTRPAPRRARRCSG